MRQHLKNLALLVLSSSILVASAYATTLSGSYINMSELEGEWYFNMVVEGGSEVGGHLIIGSSHLQQVRFENQPRFLVVKLSGDVYNNPLDPTLVSEIAKFPKSKEGSGSSFKVLWGDDPTPFVMTKWVNTHSGWQKNIYQASGKHDVHHFEFDKENGVITFVKQLTMINSDGEKLTTRQRYNFMKKKETNFKPKLANPSNQQIFGYFTSSDQLLVDEDAGYLQEKTFLTRIDINKTFTYQFHPTTPEIFKKPIIDAVESWNDVFEEKTGKRPLAIKDGDADQLPGDLRYHVIYFQMRGHTYGGYSAYGPSIAIAHTGEIVDADIVVDGTALLGNYQNRLDKAGYEGTVLDGKHAHDEGQDVKVTISLNNRALPMAESYMDRNPICAMSRKGVDQDMETLVRSVMTHEIGHNLGLRHNFAASNDFEHHTEEQKSTSIMDYQDESAISSPGVYDKAAIAFGYDGQLDPSDMGKFKFLTDEAARTHPLANRHDEGEPLAFYSGQVLPIVEKYFVQENKPQFAPQDLMNYVANKLPFLLKFINKINDERSDKAFQIIYDWANLEFSQDKKYRPVAHMSAMKYVAAYGLLNIGQMAGGELTRRQRRNVYQAIGKAVASPDTMLEEDRLDLINMLSRKSHVAALKALKESAKLIEKNLEREDLSDNQYEVEENVQMHLEKAIHNFLSK